MRLLKRREMRHFGQPQHLLEVGHILDESHDAAIVCSEELPEHQKGEQLVLGEVLLGELRGIRRQGMPRHTQGHPGQRLRRTRHASLCLHRS